jgi:hypothetical protein
VLEFQCDPERSGLEGLKTAKEDKDKDEKEKDWRRREEGGDDKEQPPSDRSQSLEFKSFGQADDDSYVLKLNWRTKYACDHYQEGNKGDSSSRWGFFTWFIIMYVPSPPLPPLRPLGSPVAN